MIGLDGGPAPLRPHPGADEADRAGLAGAPPARSGPRPPVVGRAGPADLAAYRRIRHDVFVAEQGLFAGSDADELDAAPTTVVLVARDGAGAVVGGVRIAPHGGDPDGGWWTGSRLAVERSVRHRGAVGSALVAAACAHVVGAGALRFDATVQPGARTFFARRGWVDVGPCVVAGADHVVMRRPIGRVAALVAATKEPLAAVLGGLAPGGPGWVGDDAAPVAGFDLVAACDAIVASMVQRDPEWAGWCSVLVNLNDLAAMGAEPVALLDAVAAPTVTAATRVLAGLRRAAEAYGVPVIGGHTQIGAPAALSVTALGRAASPVPGGGGRPGDELRLTVDLAGGWRPGYAGSQWDSTTVRSPGELRRLLGTVARLAPAAAKDVSMAGIVGTAGMLAEASGCAAIIDVAALPRPAGVSLGDWCTAFPGFAMLTADRPGRVVPPALTDPATSAVCGALLPGSGVALRWPDGTVTPALSGGVTGLGPAG